MINLKRAYDPPEPGDGLRLLVDRVWPRGLSKEAARIDRWLRDIAPSPELRRWFGHRPERWPEFQERYRRELEGHRALLHELARHARAGPVTLIYAARDREHNNAVVLRQMLEGLVVDPPADAFTEESLGEWHTLRHIVARLRGPNGCPWDRQQTHDSIRENLLEEAYEVLEALERRDMAKLCEELGDLLMQVALHAQMASERGDFDLTDVVRSINRKLLRRHPHVFGDRQVADAGEALAQWEALKREGLGEGESLLSSLPRALPALAYSQALQGRARRAGFPIPQPSPAELARRLADLSRYPDREQALGEVLFALAGLGRQQGLDVEGALRQVNQRLYRRIARVEAECRRRGTTWEQLTPQERAALWEQAAND